MYAVRCFVALISLTAWHGTRAIVAGLLGGRAEPGAMLDREPRAWGRQLLRTSGLHVETVGLDRLNAGQPYVYASNHASFVDIWVLLALLPGLVRFITKRELLRIPIFGDAIRATGQIALDRHDPASGVHAYDSAVREACAGRSVVVFVEGTRSADGRLHRFKKGAFVLAIAAGVPLVPVYLAGTHDVMPRGTLRLRRGPIRLTVGEPIPTAGLDAADARRLQHEVRAWFVAQEAGVDAVGGAA
ncbi:MAG TPA: lysophospholipid acyltransferase family protein [Gemmatimonadales bacterium]|nr:lysophospholipid acyltransferase family protein [Gemmatimonadales bacterium]